MVASCSDDAPRSGAGQEELPADAGVWFGMGVQLPADAGSRSQTTEGGGSTGGTEIGRSEENRIHRALVVFADKDNGFIAYTTASQGGISIGGGETASTSGNGSITPNADGVSASIIASLPASQLNTYYSQKAGDDGILMDNQVKVYVFANYPLDLLEAFKAMGDEGVGSTDWTDWSCEVSERSSDNEDLTDADNKNTAVLQVTSGLPMSNASVATAYIPKSIEDWLPFTDEEKPFEMSKVNTEGDKIDNSFSSVNMTGGPVNLQRSVARFDFKDGSMNNFTYHVGIYGKGGNTLDVELIRMNLVNMSKQFYYLQRVSNNGHASGDGFMLCGRDLPGNYVVDVAADLKCVHNTDATRTSGIGEKGEPYSKYYNFCFGSGETASEVAGQGANMNDATGEYKIWRYVTENTIPGITQQKVALSTGIVFEGMLRKTAETPKDLADAIDENYYVDGDGNRVDKGVAGARLDHPILYMFDNVLYVKFTAVLAAAHATAPGDVLNNAVLIPNKGYAHSVAEYYTAWQNAGGGQEAGEQGYAQFMEFKKAAVDAGITIYQWATDEYMGAGQTEPHKGYFCYYYYWDRHNDNGIPGVMGQMEFAVVRNNVYKISVDKIRRIGHPRRTENDPDPQTPDTPDEVSDVYLDVQVTTLPWVVRRNSVEF